MEPKNGDSPGLFHKIFRNDEKKKTHQINKILHDEKRKQRKEIKILLLGPGESGKSTFFKLFKIFQDEGGFSLEERISYRYNIYENCVTQMKAIIFAASSLNILIEDEENKKRAKTLLEIPPGSDIWSSELARDIVHLWKDPGIQRTYDRRDTAFQLNESASYFFENINRLSSDNYIPTVDDILRVRVRSTGIEEALYKFDGLTYRIVDVGGQRSERRKWIHCFDKVSAIIFCVSLTEYNQTLREEETQNRMKESLLLFNEICNAQWFISTNIVIFFNKVDLFREKIQKVDLKACFPNYTGGCDFDRASKFIAARFLEQNQNNNRSIYTHFTCAIAPDSASVTLKNVREIIMKHLFSDTDLIL